MKLHEAIVDSPEFQNFIESVKQECSLFLEVADSDFPLFRGIDEAPDFGSKAIRTNREPSDTDIISNKIYNYFAEKDTGIADLRRKVAFCSGEVKIASKFGFLNYIFPVDGTRYFYSPHIVDSITLMRRIEVNLKDATADDKVGKLVELFNDSGLKFVDIKEASIKELMGIVAAGYEIMLYGAPKYYFHKETSTNHLVIQSNYRRLLAELQESK